MVPVDPTQCGTSRKRVPENSSKLTEEEYILKRKRNNDAVNRTRQKKRREETDTMLRVEYLRKENVELEKKVEGLQKELSFLKEMFVAYASSSREKSNTNEGRNERSINNDKPGSSYSESI